MTRILFVATSSGCCLILAGGCSSRDDILREFTAEAHDAVDELSGSAGSIGKSEIRDLTEYGFLQLRQDRIAVSGVAEVYRVKAKDDAIIIHECGRMYLVEDPSIRVSRISEFDLHESRCSWLQEENFTDVDFYFHLEDREFIYIRRTIAWE